MGVAMIRVLDIEENNQRLEMIERYPNYYCLNLNKETKKYEVIRFNYSGISHKQALMILRKRYGLTPRIVGSSYHIKCLQDAGVHQFIEHQTKYNYWNRIDMFNVIDSIDFENENIIHYELNPSQLLKG